MFTTVRTNLFILMLLAMATVSAQEQTVYRKDVNYNLETTYKLLYKAMKDNKFYVLFAARISDQMARFAKRWGDDYNRQQLSGIRNMVLCNIWYTNQVANADPDMLALCPLRVAVVEKDGKSRILFARPTVMAKGSAAAPVITQVENEIISIIEKTFP